MRRRTVLRAGIATAAALALGSLAGGILAERPSAAGEARRSPELLTRLGFQYQLRWRETSDSGYLPRSERALRNALRLEPRSADAVLGLGSLALIRHEFRAALAYGRRAQRLQPGSARPYGVVGDALVELGRYREAFAAFDRMAALRPGLGSYARVAYARELTGDLRGAADAMRLARDAAAGEPEPTAFALVELAKLELLLGRPQAAKRDVRKALRIVPGYPAAIAELAMVELALGRLRPAVAAARRAADAVPTLQSVALLAALLDRAGMHGAAREQRATAAVVERLLRANGVRVDLESALHRADYRIRPAETVDLARRARAARPSIYGDDALGWALSRARRCGEALPLARRALRLGTQDPLLYFHLGYVQGCVGDSEAMRRSYRRALALNPEFSPRWAPVARAALAA